MKKLGVFGFFLLVSILLLGFASAGTCDDTKTLVKLSAALNAHAALYSDTSYSYDICYDDIFDSPYTGTTPHPATCASPLFYLSSSTNAHVSATSSSVYNIPVCFDKLACSVSTEDKGCGDAGNVVARLYSLTNSHISDKDDTNYKYLVCCKKLESGVATWANANGAPLVSADVGDTVQLRFQIGNAYGSQTVKFEIYEDDGVLGNDKIRTGSSTITSSVDSTGLAVAYWTITSADLAKTNDYDGFYFRVAETQIESTRVTISNQANDAPLNLKITSPVCASEFTKGETKDIVVSASDEDDRIYGNLTIEGSSQSVTNGYTGRQYTFSNSGNIQISLGGYNSRGRTKESISNVMIVDRSKYGVYVAACIDKPEDYSDIETSTVLFDARSSAAFIWDSTKAGNEKTVVDASKMTFSWYFSDYGINKRTGNDVLSNYFNKTFTAASEESWAKLDLIVDV